MLNEVKHLNYIRLKIVGEVLESHTSRQRFGIISVTPTSPLPLSSPVKGEERRGRKTQEIDLSSILNIVCQSLNRQHQVRIHSDTVEATRKPLFVFRFVGSFLLRLAERQLFDSLFQLPPRRTRLAPL